MKRMHDREDRDDGFELFAVARERLDERLREPEGEAARGEREPRAGGDPAPRLPIFRAAQTGEERGEDDDGFEAFAGDDGEGGKGDGARARRRP